MKARFKPIFTKFYNTVGCGHVWPCLYSTFETPCVTKSYPVLLAIEVIVHEKVNTA